MSPSRARPLFALGVLLLAAACGAIADEASGAAAGDASPSPTPSSSTDGGTRAAGDASTGTTSSSKADAAVATAFIDAGEPESACPNGTPNAGEVCVGLGPLCTYLDVDCRCIAAPGGGPPRWACGPRRADGGLACPPTDPSFAGGCATFVGARCDVGLSICVCSEQEKWLCSDG